MLIFLFQIDITLQTVLCDRRCGAHAARFGHPNTEDIMPRIPSSHPSSSPYLGSNTLSSARSNPLRDIRFFYRTAAQPNQGVSRNFNETRHLDDFQISSEMTYETPWTSSSRISDIRLDHPVAWNADRGERDADQSNESLSQDFLEMMAQQRRDEQDIRLYTARTSMLNSLPHVRDSEEGYRDLVPFEKLPPLGLPRDELLEKECPITLEDFTEIKEPIVVKALKTWTLFEYAAFKGHWETYGTNPMNRQEVGHKDVFRVIAHDVSKK